MSPNENKAVVRRYITEVINHGDRNLIDELFVPEMRERVRAFLGSGDNPFPDGHEEIQDIVAEGDLVIVRLLFRGTHRGAFLGVAPTGKAIEVTGYGTYRFDATGRIAWDTISFDWLDALEQIGATIQGPVA